MKYLILGVLIISAQGCMNTVKVPNEVQLKAPTEPIKVVHEVALSTQITDFISSDCEKIAKDNAFTPDMVGYQDYIDQCVVTKTSDLITELTNALNGGTPPSAAPNMQMKGY